MPITRCVLIGWIWVKLDIIDLVGLNAGSIDIRHFPKILSMPLRHIRLTAWASGRVNTMDAAETWPPWIINFTLTLCAVKSAFSFGIAIDCFHIASALHLCFWTPFMCNFLDINTIASTGRSQAIWIQDEIQNEPWVIAALKVILSPQAKISIRRSSMCFGTI